jgi:hypothetical protein
LTAPRKIVFAPDILIASLYEAEARAMLHQWRDGAIVPVVTRDLLLLYLRTLRQAGLGPELVRKWSLWLTAAEKVIYREDCQANRSSGLALCREVAEANGAQVVTREKQRG